MSSETSAARSSNTFTDEVVDQQIPLRDDKRIDLEVINSDGPITVRATDGNDLHVHAVKEGKSGSSHFIDAALLVDVSSNHVKIEPRFPKFGISRVFGGGVGYDITVELPAHIMRSAGARVRANTASGPVAIEDVTGDITVNTASGDVTVTRVAGEISARTASGSVRLTDPRGEVQTRSASGDVTITGGQLQRMKSTSASGDMKIASAWGGDDSSRIETVSGDVVLDILEAPDMKLIFSTVSGDAIVNHPFTHLEKRTWALGEDQRHGPVIVVRTVSGDLRAGARQATTSAPSATTVRAADAPSEPADTAPIPAWPAMPVIPPTPPIPPVPPRPAANVGAPAFDRQSPTPRDPHAQDTVSSLSEDEDRLNVLQAVERGEIDIEEALNRLDDMDEPLASEP
ncbi:MAG TPA: DUF4097 family beta strand repeat-containing protein [Thermomicrobiales bacterium]|nr:DUF4097 family beta strand repeat-containing protein [Thermomicrobiales bacterium]